MVFGTELQDWFPLLKAITWPGTQLIQPYVITCNLTNAFPCSDQYKTPRNRILQIVEYTHGLYFRFSSIHAQRLERRQVFHTGKCFYTIYLSQNSVFSCLFVLPINNTRSDKSILYSQFFIFLENYTKRWIQ